MPRSGIMLCYPFEEKRLAKWQKPWIIQPKLDGERCRAIIDDGGNCILLSSECNEIRHVPHLNLTLEHLGFRNIELDGELYIHGMNFDNIHSIVSRKKNTHDDFMDMEYHVFDIVADAPQADRTVWLKNTLEKRIEETCAQNVIQVVPYDVVNDLESIMSFAEHQQVRGFEGFVIRNAHAPYVRKRSVNMMKFKPRKDDYYVIAGYSIEVDKYLRPKPGILGRIICYSTNQSLPVLNEYPPKPKLVPFGYFGAGSGSLLTNEVRRQLWEERAALPGKILHVKYQHLTEDKVPRFPVAIEILDPTLGDVGG